MATYLPTGINNLVGKTGPPGKTYPGIIPFSQAVNYTATILSMLIGFSNSTSLGGDYFKFPENGNLTNSTIGIYIDTFTFTSGSPNIKIIMTIKDNNNITQFTIDLLTYNPTNNFTGLIEAAGSFSVNIKKGWFVGISLELTNTVNTEISCRIFGGIRFE